MAYYFLSPYYGCRSSLCPEIIVNFQGNMRSFDFSAFLKRKGVLYYFFERVILSMYAVIAGPTAL